MSSGVINANDLKVDADIQWAIDLAKARNGVTVVMVAPDGANTLMTIDRDMFAHAKLEQIWDRYFDPCRAALLESEKG